MKKHEIIICIIVIALIIFAGIKTNSTQSTQLPTNPANPVYWVIFR